MNKLLLFGALAGGAALLAACIHLREPELPIVVSVKRDGEGCRFTVEGQRATIDRLLLIGRGATKRRAIIVHDKDTPFKCIGWAVYTLQRAGVAKVHVALWDDR